MTGVDGLVGPCPPPKENTEEYPQKPVEVLLKSGVLRKGREHLSVSLGGQSLWWASLGTEFSTRDGQMPKTSLVIENEVFFCVHSLTLCPQWLLVVGFQSDFTLINSKTFSVSGGRQTFLPSKRLHMQR